MPAVTDLSRSISTMVSWKRSPLKFVKEALHVESITKQQEDALNQLGALVNAKVKRKGGRELNPEETKYANKLGISIMSGKGTGKDTCASWFIIWFLSCFTNSLIPCTAPSAHQLKDVLWKEINKWIRGPEGIPSLAREWLTWQSDKIYHNDAKGREWFAVGRTANPKASAEQQAETLSGFHEEYMMIVADECSAIPDAVFESLESTMTQTVNFAFLIFNPTRSSGFAIDSQFVHRDRWLCLRWNSEDSERVTAESIAIKASKFGKDSNHYRVNVLGLPPKADKDTLIPYEWVMDAIGREVEALPEDPVIFGIDVGAGGDDSAIVRRKGPVVYEVDATDTPDPDILVNWAIGKIHRYEPKMVLVDTIGVGWALPTPLRERTNADVIGIKVSEKPMDESRFCGLRDELWWRLRERFQKQEICIPNDDELIGELTTIRYDERTGKIKVEGKRELRARGINSPNKADALCLTEYYKSDFMRQMGKPSRSFRRSLGYESWRTV